VNGSSGVQRTAYRATALRSRIGCDSTSWTSYQRFRHQHRRFERWLAEATKGDANDALWAIEAIPDYNPEPALHKIKAKVLLINDAEDHANPPELGTVERTIKRVKHGRSD
jgi:hypothetical protein